MLSTRRAPYGRCGLGERDSARWYGGEGDGVNDCTPGSECSRGTEDVMLGSVGPISRESACACAVVRGGRRYALGAGPAGAPLGIDVDVDVAAEEDVDDAEAGSRSHAICGRVFARLYELSDGCAGCGGTLRWCCCAGSRLWSAWPWLGWSAWLGCRGRGSGGGTWCGYIVGDVGSPRCFCGNVSGRARLCVRSKSPHLLHS